MALGWDAREMGLEVAGGWRGDGVGMETDGMGVEWQGLKERSGDGMASDTVRVG